MSAILRMSKHRHNIRTLRISNTLSNSLSLSLSLWSALHYVVVECEIESVREGLKGKIQKESTAAQKSYKSKTNKPSRDKKNKARTCWMNRKREKTNKKCDKHTEKRDTKNRREMLTFRIRFLWLLFSMEW